MAKYKVTQGFWHGHEFEGEIVETLNNGQMLIEGMSAKEYEENKSKRSGVDYILHNFNSCELMPLPPLPTTVSERFVEDFIQSFAHHFNK